jgi:hypothetical protein
MRTAPFATILAMAIAAGAVGVPPVRANTLPRPQAAERAYLRTVTPLTADQVTSNLRGVVGKHVSFVCEIVSIVNPQTMIGQCGKEIEPVDLYVHMPTAGTHAGERFRVTGEMESPGFWVDVTGHTWYTPFVKARFVDRV